MSPPVWPWFAPWRPIDTLPADGKEVLVHDAAGYVGIGSRFIDRDGDPEVVRTWTHCAMGELVAWTEKPVISAPPRPASKS